MSIEITKELGEATLTPMEALMWEALGCLDLEVDMTAKIGPELRKLRSRKTAPKGTRLLEIESRVTTASRLMHLLLDALHPTVVHSLFSALMSARVERDLLMQAASDLLAARVEDEEDEDEVDEFEEAALKLAHVINDIRERNE